ncbi:bacteriophage abortive infection AbiH family protein [Shewanella marinintestina]|uniref:bacteriophage abortive infection AbiH family protein n=1 Tax=Shewanella marinintestina TaxID=190305 RepID=UPI00200C2ED8|nr:bacteriophage abortive infection AbiH family protein [Shewanella marinintestina]MCL1148072.1 bacteriophage abortive infection AbiH family protein [Shewanella marinintestina]
MKLYIIGNGFDIHHGLNTSYTSFGLYLKKHYNEVYELLLDYYGFDDLNPLNWDTMKDPLWSEFETNLSLLDITTVLEAHIDSIAVPGAAEFRDRDWNTFQIDMEMVLKKLTVDLYKAFKEFILSVQFSGIESNKIINIDRDAKYLSFNYTDTLKKYYEIPDNNVLFIHEKAEINGGELVLGHGVDPKNFEEQPEKPPLGLTAEQYEQWRQDMAEQYDYSLELGKDTIMSYFTETFKGTRAIIEKHTDFFNDLKNVEEVFVLGHSLADVDLPYFEELVKSTDPDATWIATYYSETDKNNHFDTLSSLGIRNISVVKIEEIL